MWRVEWSVISYQRDDDSVGVVAIRRLNLSTSFCLTSALPSLIIRLLRALSRPTSDRVRHHRRAGVDHMSRRRTRNLVVCSITLVVLIAAGSLVSYSLAHRRFEVAMRRCEMMAPYRDALTMCHSRNLPVPTSLKDLGKVFLDPPPDPDPSYLEYRPAGHLTSGPYLVLIERPPPKWHVSDVWVVYAYADGRCEDLPLGGFRQASSPDELRQWIVEDDRLRASAPRRDNATRPASLPAAP
jgi:hypothetical protein